MDGPPDALFITHEPPLPPYGGTRVRSLNLIRQLVARGWRVSLFSILAGAEPSPEDRAALERLCEHVVVQRLPGGRAGRLARVAAGVLRGRPFPAVYFFHRSAASALRELVAQHHFDVICAEELYTYAYVPPELRSRTVLDCHNLESARTEAMADSLGLRPRGIAARLQRRSVRRYEDAAARDAAAVLAVSEPEREYFDRLAPGRVTLVPNGVDTERLRPRASLPAAARLLFVGNLGYGANVDAVRFLMREIAPRLGRADVTLSLVGANPGSAVRAEVAGAAIDTELAGLVPDTEPYFEGSRVFVAPLRFGGGTRLKILEALARGVPVVSTSLGCEGLDLADGRELLVADDPDGFAAAIGRLLDDDELCESLARRGRAAVEQRYDWRLVGERYEPVLRRVAGL